MNQFSKRNSHIFSFQFPGLPYFPQMDFDKPHVRSRGRRASFEKAWNGRAAASPGSSPAAHRPGARGVTSNSRIKGVALVTFALPPGSASGLLPLSRVSPSLHLPLAPAPSSAPSAEPTDQESPALLSPPPRGCLSRLNAPQDAMALYLLTDLV